MRLGWGRVFLDGGRFTGVLRPAAELQSDGRRCAGAGHRRSRAWSLTALSVLLLGVLLSGVVLATASCGTSSAAGRTAPDFSGSTIQGVNVTLSEYRGKPLVLTFMASW